MKLRMPLVLVFVLLVGSHALFSQTVQRDVQAQLMLKIISLDRNMGRFGDTVTIGVTSDAMLRTLKRFDKRPIKGKSFTVGLMQTLDDIAAYNVVYIDKNWEKNYKAAGDAAIAKKVLMFCASFKAVERNEAGVAFKTVLGKPRIVMNLGVVKLQASDFPSGLLQLTMVVGNL